MSVIGFQQALPVAKDWTRRVLHFGWGTILVGAIAMAATYPGRTHGLGMVTEPLLIGPATWPIRMAGSFIPRSICGARCIGACSACRSAGCSTAMIAAGSWPSISVLLGGAVLWMSTAQHWQDLFIGLILTRGLGQSALSVVSITIVAKSFRASQLGMAMAWYAILSAPFHLLLIQGVGWALKDAGFGWRDGLGRRRRGADRSFRDGIPDRNPRPDERGRGLGRPPESRPEALSGKLWPRLHSGSSA